MTAPIGVYFFPLGRGNIPERRLPPECRCTGKPRSKSSTGDADYLKPRIAKVAVEGKCRANSQAVHHCKRDAIGEADFLICILPYPADRFDLVFSCRG